MAATRMLRFIEVIGYEDFLVYIYENYGKLWAFRMIWKNDGVNPSHLKKLK